MHEYQRFTPLVVESRGLARGYLDVQPGDCVVAFSRKDIYNIKQLIEAGTGQRWASSSLATQSAWHRNAAPAVISSVPPLAQFQHEVG